MQTVQLGTAIGVVDPESGEVHRVIPQNTPVKTRHGNMEFDWARAADTSERCPVEGTASWNHYMGAWEIVIE